MVRSDGAGISGLETNLVNPRSSDERATYSYEEVLEKSLEYFRGDELAATTWMKKYAEKDKRGEVYFESTPEDMHRRMAREFSRVENGYEVSRNQKLESIRASLSEYGQSRETLTEEKIYELFKDFKRTVPQGSVMASLGIEGNLSSLSNCVVIPEIFDSYGGIMYADQQLAQLFKRRCGAGADLSTIRPADSEVANSAGTTSGMVSYMQRLSNTTREVAQNGRRGALMLTADIRHPDIREFTTIKQDLLKVTGANVSIRLRDEFMSAVENNERYTHRWPINSENPKVKKEVDAKELWDVIIKAAHNTAEPGLIFWDRQHKYSTSSIYPGHENISTNPCSEIGMDNDSCRLFSMNLKGYVIDPFTPRARFDHKGFYRDVYESQRLMDDLVDLEIEAIDRIMDKVRNDPEPDYIKAVELETWESLRNAGQESRRTGLGETALGDTLAALGYQFDSAESLSEIERIMRTKCTAEFDSSIDMAIERGAFKDFNPVYEKDSEFVDMLREEFPEMHDRMMKYGRRNISISTVAPAGSLSLLTRTTSSIEPVFKISHKRRRKVNPNDRNVKISFVDDSGDSWEEFEVYHPGAQEWMRITGKKDISESPYANSSASEIDWIKRVEIQGIVQKYTTHSISSTVNLPEDVTPEEVSKIYFEAWKQGLKGITVYRDGSRSGVLVSSENLEDKVTLVQNKVKSHPVLDIKPQSIKYKVKRQSNDDSLHIIAASELYIDDENKKAYFIPDEDFQVRAPLGHATSVTFAQSGMDRTEILRGPNPDWAELVSRLQSATSNEEEGIGPRRIKSIEHAVGIVFEDYFTRNGIIGRDPDTNRLTNLIRKEKLRKVERNSEEYNQIMSQVRVGNSEEEGEELEISGNNGEGEKRDCPECGDKLIYEGGCAGCKSCGYSPSNCK